VADRNTAFKISDSEKLMYRAIDQINILHGKIVSGKQKIYKICIKSS